MALLYTAELLLETIRNVGAIPNAASLGSADADLLRHVNEALRGKIVPIIIQTREDYLAQSVRVGVSGQTRFRIPNRAVGNRLRDVVYVDGAGNRQLWTNPIAREDLAYYGSRGSGQPEGYFLEGNHLQLIPTGGAYSGSLELSFFMRPSALVPVEQTRKVEDVDTATGVVTLDDAVPASWTTEKLYDIHSPDSGAEVKFWDLVPTTITTPDITFSSVPIDGTTFGTVAVAIGDYVCLANECALLQVPDDLIPALAQAVALRIAISDGDTEMAKLHSGMLQDETQEARKVLENRIEGRPWRVRGRGGIRGTSF